MKQNILVLLLFIFSFNVMSKGLSKSHTWSYIETSYSSLKSDQIEGDGISVEISRVIGRNYFTKAGYSINNTELKTTTSLNTAIESKIFNLGAGYIIPLSRYNAGYFSAEYLKGEVRVENLSSVSVNGYITNLGIHSFVTTNFETDFNIARKELNDVKSTLFSAKGLYKLNPSLSFGLGATLSRFSNSILEDSVDMVFVAKYSF